MSNISVDYDILNQKQTPAFYASSLATRPAFGYPGRIFIDTDSPSSGIYRDTGSAWVQVADPGAGTTGTLQQVTTNGNTTTLAIQVQGIDISKGTGTGFENIGIGLGSLQFNTTGEYNTSIGTATLTNNRTGISNTAIGNISLFTNVGGNYNTGVGGYSLNGSLNASNNTAIGYDSMRLTTSGSNNTALGYQSGRAITTGSNNTILGNYIGTATLTSNIVLSDGAGNVRLFADANGLIAINQAVGSVPGGQIDIHTAQTYALVLNGLTTNNAYTAFSNNSVGKWRIGNTYNAGANTFDVYNLGTSSNAISINSTTNDLTFTGSLTATRFNLSGATASSGLYYNSGSNRVTIANYSATGIVAIETGGGTTALSLASNQAATFSSSVKSTSLFISNNNYLAARNAANTADRTLLTFDSSNKIIIGQDSDITAVTLGVGSEAMRITTAGRLLLGTTTESTYLLDVNGTGRFSGALSLNQANGGALFLQTAGTNNSLFTTTLQIQGSGSSTDLNAYVYGANSFGVWTNGTKQLTIASTGAVTLSNLSGTGSRAVLADANGLLSAPVSDISVKQNIKPIGYGLNEILKMNPVWFNFIDEYKNFGQSRQNGNIAQEMEIIIPEAVFTTPSTGKMGINYDQLHAVYIKAIQELNEKVNRLYINHYGQ